MTGCTASLPEKNSNEQPTSFFHVYLARARVAVRRYRYAALSLLVPFAVRAVPEVISGPYLLGFDTLRDANILLGGSGFNFVSSFNSTVYGFFYLFALGVKQLLGDAFLTMKIFGPVLLCILCGLLYVYCRNVLRWDPPKASLVSLLSGTFFVSLRISWDLHRQMLGLIFLIAALVGLRFSNLRLKLITVGLFGFLTVCTHQYVAVIFLIVMAAHFLVERGIRPRVFTASVTAPALLLFMYQRYNPASGSFEMLHETFNFATRIDPAIFISSFIGYMFLPLLPLFAVGVTRFRELTYARDMMSWLLACLVASYSPILLPQYAAPYWYRLAILSVYPLIFFSVMGAAKIWTFGRKVLGKVRVGQLLALSIIALNLVMSVYYLASVPEHQMQYFGEWNNYKKYIPSSMLQNSIPITDTPDVIEALKWVDEKAEAASMLLLHSSIYLWGRITLRNVRISAVHWDRVTWPMSNNATTILLQRAEHYANDGTVYTIWWTHGNGWYGMTELPSQFKEIQRFGDMGVFQY